MLVATAPVKEKEKKSRKIFIAALKNI